MDVRGALLTYPHSPEEIAGAMTRLAADRKLREELIEEGNRRRELFTWEKTAALLWNSLEQTLRDAGKL